MKVTQPTVCAVMITADRHELASKAVACFLRQNYPNKALLIYDTGEKPLSVEAPGLHHEWNEAGNLRGLPIGALRNNANGMVSADVILHWDDDDWSHPNRIEEQVALLQASGGECVGYNEMLFWREAEAWLYTNPRKDYAVGTSLCYWRKTWEAKQFRDDVGLSGGGRGEDYWWIQNVNLCGESAQRNEPRMIARIHSGNAAAYRGIETSPSWKRVAEWDGKVRELLG